MKTMQNIDIFRALHDQVLAWPDERRRFDWTVRAEQLLASLEPRRSYRTEEVLGVLGVADAEVLGELGTFTGAELQKALERLIRDVAEETVISGLAAREEIWTADELAARWNVATKTLTRWRTKGLIARRFLIDGRIRVGYLRATAERFASEHPELLHRGDRFSRLTPAERQAILVRAEQLAEEHHSRAEIIAQLVEETARSRETLRKLLEDSPELRDRVAVQRAEGGVPRPVAERMLREFHRGMDLEQLAKRFGCSLEQTTLAVNQLRAEAVRELPLEYMESPEFQQADADATILAPAPEPERAVRGRRAPQGLPPYLAQLYDYPLLSAEQERHLFRQYNFLKCRAARERERLGTGRPSSRRLDRIEEDYRQAVAVKNQIIRANLRLVVSIAKKYTDSSATLFERVSEGNISLMRAVEKFDYTLGFKFSTYATWAIRKNFARSLANESRHSDRFRTSQDETLGARPDGSSDPTRELEAQRQREQQVKRILRNLSERERLIIRKRFGLGGTNAPQTLKELGVELGVSKERVRQLESRAMQKLRDAAADAQHQVPGLWENLAFSDN